MQRNSCTIDFILKSLLNQTNQTHVYFWGHARQRVQSIIMQSNRIKSDITKKSLFFNTYMHCFRRFTYSYLFIIIFLKKIILKRFGNWRKGIRPSASFVMILKKSVKRSSLDFLSTRLVALLRFVHATSLKLTAKDHKQTSHRK